MRIEDRFVVAAPRERVWVAIKDPAIVAPCIPGCQGVEVVTPVERVKADLAGWRLGRCVFVGDAGMNSEDNRRSLALGNGKYILASKMRAGDEVTKDVLARPGRYHEVREHERGN